MKKNLYISITLTGNEKDIEDIITRIGDLSRYEEVTAMYIKEDKGKDYKLI